ncbi:rhodanese-like domain-containing protein [Magnetococcales bacterium HHB-1]
MRPLFKPLLILLLLLAACSPPPYTDINNQQLIEMVKQGVPLYDIRRPEEWKQTGIVAESRLLTYVDENGKIAKNFFAKLQQETNPEKGVIFICRTGNRSAHLSRYLMEKMGYTTVYNVKSGIVRWIQDRNPVVRPN